MSTLFQVESEQHAANRTKNQNERRNEGNWPLWLTLPGPDFHCVGKEVLGVEGVHVSDYVHARVNDCVRARVVLVVELVQCELEHAGQVAIHRWD